jgi:hypothetical protein
MSPKRDARGRTGEDARLAPPLPAVERFGHDWGMVFRKNKAVVGAGRISPAGQSIGDLAVSWSDGVVRVRDRRLIDSDNRSLCRDFIEKRGRESLTLA